MVQRITCSQPLPLLGTAATRRIEAAAQSALPPHTLMQRAGLAVARLALAISPHARTVWIACGPGNNGGDGLEAAMHLHQWGLHPVVTWLGDEAHLPADARASLARARQAGVAFGSAPPPLGAQDLCIDALLGIGSTRAPAGRMADWLAHMAASAAPCLAVDMPTGLNADTGVSLSTLRCRHTLALLTLKPGLFTAQGRDACGTLWFDDLGVTPPDASPTAWLNAPPPASERPHASHKGSFGDVAVIGGECDATRGTAMSGAALLAASAALHGGAGRVFVCLLGDGPWVDTTQPELMFRRPDALPLDALTVVCGCGGGDAVRTVLPGVLAHAPRAVLDADALNAIAKDAALQTALTQRAQHRQATVLTPHPLEAARLLACTTAQVQASRLSAAQTLAERFQCVVVLKGSGTVIAAPGQVPRINPSGNARLATAGTGDVLAGLIGARLATRTPTFAAACHAVWQHGALADEWPQGTALTASTLARAIAA
ncbi:MAG: NAD(P)H-hydrate dehydratase [Pseudomonadota bacterium]|nr:NAD(P)H-hydrate dehydratase [Pseudomonadota bacterium]